MTRHEQRSIATVLCCMALTLSCRAHQPDAASSAPPAAKPPAEQTPAEKAKIAAATPPSPADAAVLKDFNDRIATYMKLHEKQEKGKAEQEETKDPARIKAAQDLLAQKIHAGRATAKHGDVFTVEIRQLFRRLMYPETKGPDAKETRAAIKEESPAAPKSILKVNSRFPENQPLPTVPPNILQRLPKLPDSLEYRILNKDLILRDVDANLIVDYIPNAIQ
jgi:hypothetical protein